MKCPGPCLLRKREAILWSVVEYTGCPPGITVPEDLGIVFLCEDCGSEDSTVQPYKGELLELRSDGKWKSYSRFD